ncbi:VOC family protein [Streptomyces sp. NPDC050610]|uniref:VOC family protein n=1 Tax=Streptomyces sp. NPDC050610 TaxID=3157097 RepID=UPI00341D8161
MLTTDHALGAPVRVDLATPDVEAAAAFYRALFGWEFGFEEPEAEGRGVFRLGGREAAAAGPLTEEGTGSTWTLSFRCADVEATAEAVERAGGTVRLAPLQTGGGCAAAGFSDPDHARFAVRESGRTGVLGTVDIPGALWWTQLYTTDVAAAKRFYSAVLAWETEDVVLERGAAYTVVSPRGGGLAAAHGGIMQLPPEAASAGISPGWHPYFAVEDCDAAVATAVEHGATPALPAESSKGIGRQATLRDPFRALFSVNSAPA